MNPQPHEQPSLLTQGVQEELPCVQRVLPAGFRLLVKKERRVPNGERLSDTDPQLYAQIVEWLADGHLGIRRVARAAGVSTEMVMAIRRREGLGVRTQKKRLANMYLDAAELATETFMQDENLQRAKPGELAVAAGIFTQRAAELNGEASMIVEHRRMDGSAFSFEAFLAEVRARQAKRIEVVEIAPEIHLEAEGKEQRGAAQAPALLDAPAEAQKDGPAEDGVRSA
jgi:hypothetical protein